MAIWTRRRLRPFSGQSNVALARFRESPRRRGRADYGTLAARAAGESAMADSQLVQGGIPLLLESSSRRRGASPAFVGPRRLAPGGDERPAVAQRRAVTDLDADAEPVLVERGAQLFLRRIEVGDEDRQVLSRGKDPVADRFLRVRVTPGAVHPRSEQTTHCRVPVGGRISVDGDDDVSNQRWPYAFVCQPQPQRGLVAGSILQDGPDLGPHLLPLDVGGVRRNGQREDRDERCEGGFVSSPHRTTTRRGFWLVHRRQKSQGLAACPASVHDALIGSRQARTRDPVFSACSHTDRGTGRHGECPAVALEDTDLDLSRGENGREWLTQPQFLGTSRHYFKIRLHRRVDPLSLSQWAASRLGVGDERNRPEPRWTPKTGH